MILVADLLLLMGGYGLLRLLAEKARLGIVGTVSVSWLTGVAVLGVTTTVVGVAGLPTHPWLVGAPLFVLGLSSVRRRGAMVRTRALTLGAGALVAVIGLRIALIAARIPSVHNDEYAIWALRGRALSELGRLDPSVFANADALYQHLDYPLLVPSLVAWTDRFGGGEGAWHVQVALLAVALLGVVAWGVARMAGPLAALVAVTSCVAARHFPLFAIRIVGDLAAAAYALAAVLLLLSWLREEESWQLRLGAVMATGAVYTKNEGAVFILLACVLAASVARRIAPLAPIAIAAVAYAPWFVWVRLNDLGNDVVNTQVTDRAALTGGRLRQIVSGLAEHWPVPAWWLLLLAASAAIALRDGRWREVVVVAGTAAGSVGALAAIYVVTPLEVTSHIDSSAHRVLMFPALLTAVGMPLFAARSPASPSTTDQSSTPILRAGSGLGARPSTRRGTSSLIGPCEDGVGPARP